MELPVPTNGLTATACTHKQDATIKLRLRQVELEQWSECAKMAGMSLSAWMREQCNAGIEHQAEIETAAFKSRKTKQCAHGIGKGVNCWQCGGMAVVAS